MPEGRILLVDGANVLYRAFYAIPGLSTRDGRPTNAVFGFVRTMRQMDRLWKPTHWGVAMDGGVPPGRMKLLPEYKANRLPMPEALRVQLEPLEEYLAGARIPMIRVPEQEADDVIASLAAEGERQGFGVLILTSDKDMLQLVTDRVSVILPSKADTQITPDRVVEKMGVLPSRIVEWLALVGDAVDNVPGIPGVGPKTAARILEEIPSLVEALEHPETVPSEKTRRKLIAEREQILRNIEIVRLNRAIQNLPTLDSLRVQPPDAGVLIPFFDRMEFHSMAEDMRTGSLFDA